MRVSAPAPDGLELVERAKRGRLKLYIGFAAGVGKTYRMLEEAHALRGRGVDVVLGLIEPHGRRDTEALIEGLELIPRRRVEYRGIAVEELDVDAVLARRPQVAVIDEIAHTNAPGSRNRKRFQDVLDVIDAGIDVIAAFNVQHLDSLNAVVRRVTGVTVRETVPDSFFKQADQVVNLDLAVEDLVDRLRAGKIYPADRAAAALEHFFKDDNLAALRELALREVAESLERTGAERASARRAAWSEPPRQRIMVCLSSYGPRAALLLRRGSRMAGRLNTDWFVVYVETPAERPDKLDQAAQRSLRDHIDEARELGAEVVWLEGKHPVESIIDFARSHGVGTILVGRSHRPWWKQLLGRSVPLRLVREAAGLDVLIVAADLDRPDDEEGA